MANKRLDPTILDLQTSLESDTELHELCCSMITEATSGRAVTAKGSFAISSVQTLMEQLDFAISHAPEWPRATDDPHSLAGLPFNQTLLNLMETPSGRALFKRTEVNQHLKAILKKWAEFLETRDSLYVLNGRNGWLSRGAIAKLEDMANRATGHHRSFTELYECPSESDPDTLGFQSWDAFFSRRFKPDVRPLPCPRSLNTLPGTPILNSCESKPWQISRNCSVDDEFSLKGQLYSLRDMLGNDPLTDHFHNGTVYQGYLSALSYHGWHSPVSGTIIRVRYIDGSYFSQLPMSDPLAMEKSQCYLANVATRAVVIIETPEPSIGLVCFIAVGMGEVSSCVATVREGDHVEAGDDIGGFHYGGSTHCLVFSGKTHVEFEEHVGDEGRSTTCNVPVKGMLARCFPKPIEAIGK
ncbi:hypothetical protein ACN38_g10511 [Penicillium nordicum]|uniref:L-tryptophan decarboxylase PsiD-like domain-containing protein n=1 Tax=Penicillium nordicum TaxID=229535 RepID=A0A0M9WBN0_9EURO|nr:hypothetical protein ACN38_g10511 [Penicillium nordicum]